MASSGVNVAVVALVVALIALLVTVSQLLGQLFATAEGSRKCSRSVIGHWSTLTTWKWHWSEWRFETIFASPELYLGTPFEYGPRSIDSAFPCGSRNIRVPNKIVEVSQGQPWELLGMDDNALNPFRQRFRFSGWTALLSDLHELAAKHHGRSTMRRCRDSDSTSWPGMQLRHVSWDSMPSDVVSPVALTTLGDIAVLARRMGISWKTFQPDMGLLAVEGCGHSLSSVEVRALGLTLRYLGGHSQRPIDNLAGNTDAPQKLKGIGTDRSHVWTREADLFMFGIFPGDRALELPNFQVNTEEDVRKLMYDVFELKSYKGAPDWKDFFYKRAWFQRYEINELRGYVCPIIRQRGSTSNLLCYPKYWADIYTFNASRRGFKELLSQRLKTKPSKHLQQLQPMLPNMLRREHQNRYDLEWLEPHHDCHDFTTKYFQNLNTKYDAFFWNLLRAHFSKAPLISKEARDKIRQRKEQPRNPHFNDGGHPWRSEQVTMMWEHLPHYVSFMQDANPAYTDETEIEEAWITLVFRAICWGACHDVDALRDSEDFLPTQWCGSQLPVYLL